MNKNCFKVIFNKKRGQMMAVAENSIADGKDTQSESQGSHSGLFGVLVAGRSKLALNILSFSLMVATGMVTFVGAAAIADAAGVVADPNAPGNQKPIIVNSANGTTQVNIQTPSKNGVSMNQYKQFDVDQKGLILNNSRTNVNTQIGGYVQGNQWLAGGEARVIVNQVNSSNPSALNGYIEVAGRKADVVIANPNGLNINGAGFINAGAVTLTTGNPLLNNGQLNGFNINKGVINITGQGLDARGADYTRIISQATNIQAGIWGQDVTVIAGNNTVDAQNKVTASQGRTDGSAAPQWGIDAGTLGGMYAGKITLISTEKGVGINNAGQMFASAGQISISADGMLNNTGAMVAQHKTDANQATLSVKATDLNNSGSLSSQGKQSLTTQNINNTGLIASGNELNIRNSGHINNEKGTINAARLDIDSKILTNKEGKIVQTGMQSLALEADTLQNINKGLIGYTPVEKEDPSNPGTGTGDGGNTGGENPGTGEGGKTPPSTGEGKGKIEVNPNPTAPMTLAKGQIKVKETLINDAGQITANGGIDLTSHNGLDNSNATLNLNELKVTGNQLKNVDGVITSSNSHIGTQAIDNTRGQLQAQDSLTIQSQKVINHKGLLAAGKKADLTVAELDNSQEGNVLSQGDLSIDASTSIDNQTGKILTGKQQTIKTPVLNNQQGQIEAGSSHIAVDTLNNQNKGAIRSNESVTVVAKNQINNQQGQITSAGNVSLHDNQQGALSINNQDGEILSGKDQSIQAKNITPDGKLAAGNNLNIDLVDSFTTQNTIVAGNELNIKTQGDLTNKTALQAGNKVSLDAKNIDNQATGSVEANQQVKLNAQENITNRGLINSSGQTLIQAKDTVSNIGTGKIYGDHVAIGANKIINKEEAINDTTKAAVVAARERLDLGAKEIINQEEGLLYSGNQLSIGGALDDKGLATGRADKLINASARIESVGDAKIAVNDLKNLNTHFKVEEYLAKSEKIKEWAYDGGVDKYREGRDGWMDKGRKEARFNFNDGRSQLKGNEHNWHWWNYTESTYKERVTDSKPGEIIIGGNLIAEGNEWTNNNSHIIVGENLIQTELGTLNNLETLGNQRIVQNGTWGNYSYKRGGKAHTGKKKLREETIDDVNSTVNSTYNFEQPIMVFEKNAQVKNSTVDTGKVDVAKATDGKGTDNNAAIKTLPEMNTKLPNSSLFGVNPNGKEYLIETDPRFTDYKKWLGGDYMLKMLTSDPTQMHKRLGDGYYEQRLINQQVNQLTGYRRLTGYSDDEAQFKALMDAGVTFAKSQNLVPGVALTADQIARLTSDIVWYQSEQVTLPNGTVETVLVPKVYLVARHDDLNTGGALVSANGIQLNLTNDLNNTGTIAGREVVNLGAQNINNGGLIQGGQIGLTAQDKVNVVGGSVVADTFLSVKGKEVNIVSQTKTSGDKDNGSTIVDRVAGLYVTNADKGILAVEAEKDINVKGAMIGNAAKDGQTQLVAKEGNINIGTVDVAHYQSYGKESDKNHYIAKQDAEAGSTIQTNGNFTAVAGNELNIRQSEIDSVNGKVTLHGTNGVSITEGRQKLDSSASMYNKSSGLLSTTKTQDVYKRQYDEAVGSTVTGKAVQITSDKDILVRGSEVISDQGTYIAGQNVNVEAAKNTFKDEEFHSKTKSGLMGSGGIGFTIGSVKEKVNQDNTSLTHTGSTVGSLEGDTTIIAKDKYTQVGSTVASPKGDVNIAGKSIDIVAAEDQYASDYRYERQQKGLTVAVNVPVLEALKTAMETAKTVGKSKNDRVNAMAAANAAWDGQKAGKALAGLGAEGGATKAAKEVSVSITYGQQKSVNTTHTEGTQASSSQVNAGGKVNLQATGGGQESNINIIGSDVAGKGGTNLVADNEININAFEQNHTERSKNKSTGWNAGVAISYGSSGGMAFGVTAGGNYGRGYGDGDETTYRASHVGDKDSQTNIQSGGATNVIGGQIIGKGVAIDATELNIESLQDTAKFKGKQENISAQVTVGYGFSASGDYSKSKIKADYASVNEQAGVYAGDDGFNINVKGNTNLKGALITSTEAAEKNGKNQLTTGTITTSDIQNHSDYKASGFSIGGGISRGGKGENKYSGQEFKNTANKSAGYGKDSGSDSSVTGSGVYTKNIDITDADGQKAKTGQSVEDAIRSAQTNVSTEMAENYGGLKNNFDKEKVQKEIDLQVDVTKKFDKTRQEIKQEIYNLADQKKAKAEQIRKENFIDGLNGYNTQESLDLEASAIKLEKRAFYLDLLLGGLYGWGNPDAIKYVGTAVATDPVRRAATAAEQIWVVKCNGDSLYCSNKTYDGKGMRAVYDENGNLVDTRDPEYKGKVEIGDKRQIFDITEIKPGENSGVITISNPGIMNPLNEALKNAVKQNNVDIGKDGIVVINNPETSNVISEILYAGYDKLNDFFLGGRLPLTTAEKANIKLYEYAKNNNFQIDLSNHSRGGLTASVAIQNANRNGLTEVPIRESRFYGTATNVQDYANWLNNKNGYTYDVDGLTYGSAAYSAVHYTDFVGRSPLITLRWKGIVGGNSPTGGVEDRWFMYSHSSYFKEKPEKKMLDNQGYYIDKNGKRVTSPINNPYSKDFEKKWSEGENHNKNKENPSLPVLVQPEKSKEGIKYNEKPH